jgi:hypothetical protein
VVDWEGERMGVLFHGFKDQQAGRPLLGMSKRITSFGILGISTFGGGLGVLVVTTSLDGRSQVLIDTHQWRRNKVRAYDKPNMRKDRWSGAFLQPVPLRATPFYKNAFGEVCANATRPASASASLRRSDVYVLPCW